MRALGCCNGSTSGSDDLQLAALFRAYTELDTQLYSLAAQLEARAASTPSSGPPRPAASREAKAADSDAGGHGQAATASHCSLATNASAEDETARARIHWKLYPCAVGQAGAAGREGGGYN